MGGKSRETIVGYRYYLGMHVVVCQSPIDGISEIQFGDRSAWQGLIQDGQISINRPELFGGQSREGGVAGFVDVEGGAATQQANDYLSTYLRPGQLMPAFRGVFGLVFRRFYWGNNPYIKPMRLKVANVFNTYDQWLPGLAPIGGEVSLDRTAIHIAIDQSDSMNADSKNTNVRAAVKAFLDDMAGFSGVSVRIQPFNNSARPAYQAYNVGASEITAAKAFIDGMSSPSSGTNYDAGLTGAESFFSGAESAIGGDVAAVNFVSAASGDTGSIGDTGANNAMRRVILFLADGFGGDSATYAAITIAGLSGNPEVYAVGLGQIGDLETIDNTPQDGVPVITTAEAEITGILGGAFNYFVDLNPAHILRDVLISPTSDGSGDTSEIGATFAAAAQTLFDEGFGLSFFWQNTSDKEAFKSLVERHIGAAVYRDNAGLWQIKLIRPDYTVGSLFTYDSATISEWIEYDRPQQFELPNSITVVYTRRDNGEDASVTLHNVAAIQATGRVINEKLEFEGITRPELANKVAQRELIAKTQPLARGAIRVAYVPSDVNLGSAIIIDEPRMGLDSMVCRVTEIEEGEATETSVIIRFVEDVFQSDPANASFGSGDAGTQDDNTAEAADVVFFEELSYFDQALQRGQSQADDDLTVDPGLGNWQLTADRPTAQHIDAAVVRYDYPTWVNVSSAPLMPVWTLAALLTRAADDTTFSATATGREYELEAGQRIQIGSEIMRLDSVVVASGVATFTVGRGCLDTVPQRHAANAPIMAWPGYVTSDGIDYTDGEAITVRVLPRTPSDQLALGLAADNNLTMASRAFRPLPVGQLKVSGSYLPSGILSGLVEVTWAHRDRLTQTTTAIADHTAADIGPEAGVSYHLVRRLIDLVSGVETVSHEVEEAISPAQATSVYVDLSDTSFSVYAGADTIAMEIGIKTVRETSPEYENWQTPFVRFETAFANLSSSSSGGGGGASAPAYFLAQKNTTQALSGETEMTFDVEVVDSDGCFASNRFTVPAGLDGTYMSFAAGMTLAASSSNHLLGIEVSTDSGSSWTKIAEAEHNNYEVSSVETGPRLLSTGDIYRVTAEDVSNGTLAADRLCFFSGVSAHDEVTAAFRAQANATQALTIGSTVEVNFASEIFDTAGAFASNRYTVPAAHDGKLASFSAGVNMNGTDAVKLFIQVSTDGGSSWDDISGSSHISERVRQTHIHSVPLTEGHIYRVGCFIGTTSSVISSPNSFFSGVIY